jgi:hypothetical protein
LKLVAETQNLLKQVGEWFFQPVYESSKNKSVIKKSGVKWRLEVKKMPKRRYLTLTETEQEELEKVRDTHSKPYIREKAGALLKIAAGQSGHQVAQVAISGLLKSRDPDSIYKWLDKYEAEGVTGLEVKEGRGRKPAFSP